MKFVTIFLGLFSWYILLPETLLAQGSEFSLNYCYEQALKNSIYTDQQGLIAEGLERQQHLTKTNFLPQVSLNGQATLQSDVTSVPISFPGIEIPQPQKDQYKITLDLTYSIWDGGLTNAQSAINKALSQVEESKNQVDQYTLYESVSAAYFGALLAERQISSLSVIQNELQQRILKMEAAVQNGIAIKTNRLALEAKRIEIDQQIADATRKKNNALEVLSLLIGAPVPVNTTLVIPERPEIASVNRRPELAWFQAQKSASVASETMLKAKNRPKVNLFATGGYGRPALNFLSNQFDFYAIGGINIKVPLTHFYTRSGSDELQLQTIQQEKIENASEQLLKNIEIKLTQQKSEIERLEQVISTDEKLLNIRIQIREVAATQLDNGVITTNDYIAELSAEDLTRQSKILHEIQLDQAYHNLELILGK